MNDEQLTQGDAALSADEQEARALRLQVFRNEIDQFQTESKGGHFKERINVQNLNETDEAIYAKAKNGTITQEDIDQHARQLDRELMNEGDEISAERSQFEAYIRNLAAGVMGQRDLKERASRRAQEKEKDTQQ